MTCWQLHVLSELGPRHSSTISGGNITTHLDNNSLLEHFQAQQQKLVAFAMQLGAVSVVLGLNKQVLIMIANALLGRSLVESTVVGPMGEHTAEELHASTIYDMIANEGDM